MNASASIIPVEFTRALLESRFVDAHSMLSRSMREEMTPEELEERFRSIATYDEGTFTEFEEMEGLEQWPDKQPADIRWAYVAISGKSARHEGYISEAVQVVVATEGDRLTIRFLEFGRP